MSRPRSVADTRVMDRKMGLNALGVLAMGLILMLGFTSLLRAEERIITSHGFSEFGDLKYPAGFAHFDYVNPDAPRGGELSYGAQGTFDSFNPYTRKGRGAARSTEHFESLLISSYDEPGSAYGLVAESLEYPESQDWVIFNMRPEAVFSDGSPVTADDVVFSHNILLDQGLKSYAEFVRKMIPKAEALSPHRVKFYFSPDFPRRGMISQVGGTPIFSKAWFEADPENRRLDEPRLDPGIGSGPYMLESYDINRRVVYKRNPNYWGDKVNVNIGRHNYDRIRIEYFTDSVAAMEGFKSGAFTLRQENNSKNWATAYDFPALHAGNVIKGDFFDGNPPGASGFVFNLDRPQFSDIRVRAALQLGYNFEWTNESLQYGLFQQRHSFWQGTNMQATGLPQGRELEILQSLGDALDPEILTTEAISAHDSSAKRQNDRRNLRKAMTLLDAAGWAVGDDGIRRNAAGETLRVEFLSDQPTLDRIIQPYVDNLVIMGIDAHYNRIDNAQFTARRRDRDFDLMVAGYRSSLQPSTGLYQMYGEDEASYSLFNPTGVHGADIEPLIDNIVAATTTEELQANARALDRVLLSKRIMVPTWYLGKYWVAYWDMYKFPANLPPFALGFDDLWWIDGDRAAALISAGALR